MHALFINPSCFLWNSIMIDEQWQRLSFFPGEETRFCKQTAGNIFAPFFFALLAVLIYLGICNCLRLSFTRPRNKLDLGAC